MKLLANLPITLNKLLLVLFLAASPLSVQAGTVSTHFLNLFNSDATQQQSALTFINQQWHPGYVPMILETLRFTRDPSLSQQLIEVMQKHTKQNFGFDTNQWWRWLWSQPDRPHPDYADYKTHLYKQIDPRFAGYFQPASKMQTAQIRLDEIRWGGVMQDGIPPLRQPKMIAANSRDARYLADSNIVFGVFVNGEAKAYPQRILAWHEMFVDTIGGTEYAGVYCTLCGSVVLYETHLNGIRHDLGTSGFLFRSNKLMYDRQTHSLWNTTWGKPVLGDLVGKNIQLKQGHVVTTTWGEWRKRHPETLVLSLDTGHQRDYGEGVAYQQYFADHKLMFAVPKTDNRLQNKDEVLALQFPETKETLAIDQKYLMKTPIHHDQVGNRNLVILTDSSGANRVYDANGVKFVEYDGDGVLKDNRGLNWTVQEEQLIAEDGRKLARLPARRAFWFGWFAAYNDTRLVM